MTYTLEQIKENRRKWAKALRSGRYKQAHGVLREKGRTMCCLGVLADIAGCEWKRSTEGEWSADGQWRIAPQKAMDFVGLRLRCAFYGTTGLAEQNDRFVPFTDIAAIIEREPEGLFIPDAELASQP